MITEPLNTLNMLSSPRSLIRSQIDEDDADSHIIEDDDNAFEVEGKFTQATNQLQMSIGDADTSSYRPVIFEDSPIKTDKKYHEGPFASPIISRLTESSSGRKSPAKLQLPRLGMADSTNYGSDGEESDGELD